MEIFNKGLHEDYLRSLMFGLQDGIVSTTGLVVGISTGIENKEIIVLAAIVAVMVEASSMAAGQYSSEKAVHQMHYTKEGQSHTDDIRLGAIIMFFAYLLGGSFSIIPTIIFNQPLARILAVIFSFIGLFIAGYIKGKLVNQKPLRSAIELFIIGAVAIIVGVTVGYFLKV